MQNRTTLLRNGNSTVINIYLRRKKNSCYNPYVNHYQKINRKLLTGWAMIVIILLAAYLLEVLKGSRTVSYCITFTLLTVIPFLVSVFAYRKAPDSPRLKYYVGLGYLVMYLFVLITGNTILVFTYIFPLLSLLILYHDRKLIFVMGLIALVVNLVVIMTSIIGGEITLENSRDAEIMIALIVLVFTFSYSASELYEEISNANDAFNEELEKKTSQLSDMTMQTITTIANTIDAKDGYTEGHSARVAQYSRLLAKKLGKSDEEADEIYNIALLHDIGKIGVPDSILNKPGKLTEEEFNMIKQHPMIGAKILNDVKSYPSLQTGAKYHHERYDGRGYPEGLSGTEIPEIARIICVADSFDAMHSNRVYRRHFTKEYIRSELEHCQGTQFDPEIAKAMLELIDEGALEGIDTRREENFESPDGGRGMAQFSGIDRRSHETPEIQKELEAVSNHIRDYLVQTDEKDLLDTLAEENRIQDFEMKAGELLQADDGCLILLDIDQFSNLNHKYGFLCGDVCLRMIAETLLGCENMLVCRYEGDSFLAFRQGTKTSEEAVSLIDGIRNELDRKFDQVDALRGITLSFAAALSTVCGRRFARMLSGCEKAMIAAKKYGKNGTVIYKEYGDEEKLAVEKDLDSISSLIEKEYGYEGAFDLEYREFGRVYELIRNLGIRNAQTVQLVLFTILFSDNASMPISDRTMVMKYLEAAINNTVRKVDVTARFSSTQRIVLFTNLPDENVQMVIDRIMKEFYRMIPENQFRLVYVSRNINLKQLKGRHQDQPEL